MTRSLLICVTITFALAGCGSKPPTSGRVTENQQLRDENAKLKIDLTEREDGMKRLAEQVAELQKLPAGRRLDLVPTVDHLGLGSLSGGYDDNHDGVDDGVVVYVKPIDADQHVIKAAGAARVRLFDLQPKGEPKEIGVVELTPQHLRLLWYGQISSHYTIKVPWAKGLDRAPHKSVTVNVGFTDYLTGRYFGYQQAFEVKGAAE